MHLQDARCMNSSSSRSAGRLLHRLVLLPRWGRQEDHKAAHTHTHIKVTGLGSKGCPVIIWGSLHPPAEVRLGIMAVPAAGRPSPATQQIPVERPEMPQKEVCAQLPPLHMKETSRLSLQTIPIACLHASEARQACLPSQPPTP